MGSHIFSLITQRRAERPLLVSMLGWWFLAMPLIGGLVFLIAKLFFGPDTTLGASEWGAGLLLVVVLGVFSVLGYGVLVLNRLSFWILAGMALLGSVLDLIERVQTGTLSVFTFAGYGALAWFLLDRSVRTAFRY
jgi:hypothetical protein